MTSNHLLWARRFAWSCCVALVLVIQLGGASQAALTRATTQFEALPLVRSRQNHLLVRAFINGRPAWLTVDSGAPVSAIALNRREYFRLKPITTQSSLPAQVQINGAFNKVAIARELRIGGLILADEPVVPWTSAGLLALREWRTNRRSTGSSERTSFSRHKRSWTAKSSY